MPFLLYFHRDDHNQEWLHGKNQNYSLQFVILMSILKCLDFRFLFSQTLLLSIQNGITHIVK